MTQLDVKWIRQNKENPLFVRPAGGTSNDAFGRQRVSTAKTIFNAYFVESPKDFLFDDITSGTGTVTRNTTNTSIEIACASGVGSSVRQTKEYFHYISGVSPIAEIAARFGTIGSNVVQRIGLFDDDNGLFFELDNAILSVVIRSNVSGSVVENKVAQSSWNMDKLDGAGVSGITLDITKAQIFLIDYQWLSIGRVRFCMVINGETIIVHEFSHSNIVEDKYMNTGSLPLRCEVEHTGATAGATELCLFCLAYLIEGELDGATTARSANRGTSATTIVNGVYRPIISIRLRAGIKGTIIPDSFSYLVTTADASLVEIRKNATLSNGTNWQDLDSTVCQRDIGSADISGGDVVYSQYVYNQNELSIKFEEVREKIVSSIGDSDILTICAISLDNNANAYGSINFRELY